MDEIVCMNVWCHHPVSEHLINPNDPDVYSCSKCKCWLGPELYKLLINRLADWSDF